MRIPPQVAAKALMLLDIVNCSIVIWTTIITCVAFINWPNLNVLSLVESCNVVYLLIEFFTLQFGKIHKRIICGKNRRG